MHKQGDTIHLIVEEDQAGGRLDAVLGSLVDQVSRSYVAKLIESGAVRINDQSEQSKKYKVKQGDRIQLMLPEAENLSVQAESIPLDIVYEDKDVLVINKPKGMVVHPAAGNNSGTLVNAILYHCKDLSSINGVIRPGIVHRIDKDTTGLIMVAKNDASHQSLAEQLKAHTITRAYHAIVLDNLKLDQGTVRAPIGRDPSNRLRMAVTDQNSRDAVTHYTVLERFGKFTYLEARLETGRTHQIRVHMAYLHHPLLGDQVYGPKKPILGVSTQMLHAKILGFQHPATGKHLEFDSPLPEEFAQVLSRLRERI